jgi:transcriptional regulator with XRE-family HTH domain
MRFNSIKIFTFMEENKLSKAQFCKRCGISVGTLNRLLGGSMKVRVSIIIKIASFTKISSDNLYIDT